MKITYHSDDIGLTPTITKRILTAWRDGLITSFSVIANGLGLALVKQGLADRPNLEARIAVHLNLTDGKALASNHKAFVTPNGDLHGDFFKLLLLWMRSLGKSRSELLSAIEAEWSAQIEAVKEASGQRNISAIDGHTHIHMLPFLFPIAARLAKKYNIPEIRVSDELFHLSPSIKQNLSSSFAINCIKNIVLRICSIKAKPLCHLHALSYHDSLIGILFSGNMTASAANAGILKARKAGIHSVEVLFHIGRATQQEINTLGPHCASAPFALSPWRDKEYAELTKLRLEIKPHG